MPKDILNKLKPTATQPTIGQNLKDHKKYNLKTIIHKDYFKDLGALQHNKNLLMNPQIWIHMFLPHHDHDRAKAFNFSGFPLKLGLTLGSKHGLSHQAIPALRVELLIEMLNISPYHSKVSIWLTRKNVAQAHTDSCPTDAYQYQETCSASSQGRSSELKPLQSAASGFF